ncbi:unnamed protein product [Vitrella brassicaformis CCMP3155]|uniref:Uncharacterized protein n=1 Tax=Vitrella brassicaformis (strain CCMP3155) TaxID=1169540 RepID=A0A0G4FF29_VITBC|nr:unnamed protein product [Vitrella brassicaformis CCMP3155]|eukprot:CEM11440.1 unnamed protein product [Vitrella brassicaformis CCMP3155]
MAPDPSAHAQQHYGRHDGGYVAVKQEEQEDYRHDSGNSCVSMSLHLAHMPPPGLAPPAARPDTMPPNLHEPLQPASQVSRNESDVRGAKKEAEGSELDGWMYA